MTGGFARDNNASIRCVRSDEIADLQSHTSNIPGKLLFKLEWKRNRRRFGVFASPNARYFDVFRAWPPDGYAQAVAGWFGREANVRFLPGEQFRSLVTARPAEVTWAQIARSRNCIIEKGVRLLGYAPRHSSLEAARISRLALRKRHASFIDFLSVALISSLLSSTAVAHNAIGAGMTTL